MAKGQSHDTRAAPTTLAETFFKSRHAQNPILPLHASPRHSATTSNPSLFCSILSFWPIRKQLNGAFLSPMARVWFHHLGTKLAPRHGLSVGALSLKLSHASMQSDVVAAEMATRCGFVQRVEHTIVYGMRELFEVDGTYCCSVADGHPVTGIGKTRAQASVVDAFVEVGPADGVGVEHSVLDVDVPWSFCEATIARPMKPPTTPAMIAMSSPYTRRNGHRVHFCRVPVLTGPRSWSNTSF